MESGAPRGPHWGQSDSEAFPQPLSARLLQGRGAGGASSTKVLKSISRQVEPASLRGATCPCPHPGPYSLLGPHVTHVTRLEGGQPWEWQGGDLDLDERGENSVSKHPLRAQHSARTILPDTHT